MIERASQKRGRNTDGRADMLLHQQRSNGEIIDSYRTRKNGYLDKQGVDQIVCVPGVENPEEKFKNVFQQINYTIKDIKRRKMREGDGLLKLKRLAKKTAIFRVITFDLTSSESGKRKKEARNCKKGRKNSEPILAFEVGESWETSLQKLRKIEGIIILNILK